MDPAVALLSWLESLSDADSVAVTRWLADNKTSGPVVSAFADERVWKLTRDAPARDVAEALGMSVTQVNRAIQRRNLRAGDKPPAVRRRSVS
jgi:hypothetical protein